MAKLTSLAADTLVAPVRHHVGRAVKERRIGNLSADRGLDFLTFFLADVQTGFGPFIAVYLTEHKWTAAQIGAVLGIGSITAMAAQILGGRCDRREPAEARRYSGGPARRHGQRHASGPVPRALAGGRGGGAARYCELRYYGPGGRRGDADPGRPGRVQPAAGPQCPVHGAGQRHRRRADGFCRCPHRRLGPVLARGTLLCPRNSGSVGLPPRHESEPRKKRLPVRDVASETRRVLTDRRLLAFILCVVLFFVGNGFLLPLAMNRLGNRISAQNTNECIAACLLVAQAMVALISPWMGRKADEWGRRRVLMLGFASVPVHAILLAIFGNLYVVIGLEVLDGMGGAMYGVLQPLVAADITNGTNRYNLVLGVLGLAAGLGTSAGQYGGGFLATHLGYFAAFAILAGVGALAVVAVWLLLPETKDDESAPKRERQAETGKDRAPARERPG